MCNLLFKPKKSKKTYNVRCYIHVLIKSIIKNFLVIGKNGKK